MLVFGHDVLLAMPAQFVSIRVEVKVYSNSNYWNKLSSPVHKLKHKRDQSCTTVSISTPIQHSTPQHQAQCDK